MMIQVGDSMSHGVYYILKFLLLPRQLSNSRLRMMSPIQPTTHNLYRAKCWLPISVEGPFSKVSEYPSSWAAFFYLEFWFEYVDEVPILAKIRTVTCEVISYDMVASWQHDDDKPVLRQKTAVPV